MSDELTPITRKETFLAKAGGQNVVTPTPITREETFLQAIIDNGSGGGGGGGVLVCNVDLEKGALDKTWKEIHDAPFAVVHFSESPFETAIVLIHSVLKDPVTGECTVQGASSSVESATVTWYNVLFIAESENDYPAIQE